MPQLSSFGFLSGTTVTVNQTTPNAGLLDQRAAFEWVKEYIHLFGGDANNVAIFGQFSGGGSVIYHTTWLSGRNSTQNSLFKRAIAQSPFSSVVTDPQRRYAFDAFLEIANSSLLTAFGVCQQTVAFCWKRMRK